MNFADVGDFSFSADQKETIDKVLETYGDKSSQWLSDQIRSEAPWIEARKGIDSNVRGNSKIKLCTIQEYYLSL